MEVAILFGESVRADNKIIGMNYVYHYGKNLMN